MFLFKNFFIFPLFYNKKKLSQDRPRKSIIKVVLPSLALSKSGTMGLRKKVLISALSSPVHILLYK
jgi:hypothetical protein